MQQQNFKEDQMTDYQTPILETLSRPSVYLEANDTIQRKPTFNLDDFSEYLDPTEEFQSPNKPIQDYFEAVTRESIYVNDLQDSNFTFQPSNDNYFSKCHTMQEDKFTQTCEDLDESINIDNMSEIGSLKYELQLWKRRFNDQVRHNLRLFRGNKELQKDKEDLILLLKKQNDNCTQ